MARLIQVIGADCARCRKLAENATLAAAALGAGCQVQRVTEIVEILKFDISATPALVVDGQVKLAGRVASVAQITKLIGS